MTWQAVHQLVPILHRGDAIGDHVLWLQERLRADGVTSEIYVDVTNDDTADLTHPLSHLGRHVVAGRTLFLYHVAQASRCASAVVEQPECTGVIFHNFTPSSLLVGWDTSAASDMLAARRQLEELAPSVTLGISDSQFNADELADCGVSEHAVVPLPVVGSHQADSAQSRGPAAALAEQGTHTGPPTVLFVGRVASNKGFHDLLSTAAVLRATLPEVRFRLVGGSTSSRYSEALNRLSAALGIDDAVTFTGRVSVDQLANEYRSADVFCCLSDHEGFGVPLIEAMHSGLPIVAFDAGAVGETVGDAGIVLPSKEPTLVATALERVLTDDELRTRLVAAGRARVANFGPDAVWPRFTAALERAWELHDRATEGSAR